VEELAVSAHALLMKILQREALDDAGIVVGLRVREHAAGELAVGEPVPLMNAQVGATLPGTFDEDGALRAERLRHSKHERGQPVLFAA